MFLKIAILYVAVGAAFGTAVLTTQIPVCASNGQDYPGFEAFNGERERLLNTTGERIRILKLGKCEPLPVAEPPNCSCPEVASGHPVCASNGRTYDNICRFRCHRQALEEQTGERILIQKLGDCQSVEKRSVAIASGRSLRY